MSTCECGGVSACAHRLAALSECRKACCAVLYCTRCSCPAWPHRSDRWCFESKGCANTRQQQFPLGRLRVIVNKSILIPFDVNITAVLIVEVTRHQRMCAWFRPLMQSALMPAWQAGDVSTVVHAESPATPQASLSTPVSPSTNQQTVMCCSPPPCCQHATHMLCPIG